MVINMNLSIIKDYDDIEYVVLATSHDCIEALAHNIRECIFPNRAWIDHIDDIFVRNGHTNMLLIKKSVWDTVSNIDQAGLMHYANGWVDALDRMER